MNEEEEAKILQEVRDHAAYWHSDMAKRVTVEKHLSEKGIKYVAFKVELLIGSGRLVRIPRHRGDYLKVKE